MYLALFRAKMCPECGRPLGHVKLNENAKSGYNTILHLVLDLFSLPEGLHCLFKLGLTLFQVIKEHHIDRREVGMVGLCTLVYCTFYAIIPIVIWYLTVVELT